MELTDYIQYVVALAFVLALIGMLFWGLKKFRGSALASGTGGKRLNIVEGAAVDAKRRLILVRRDHIEHLILIGPMGDLVVEAGITGVSRPGRTAKSQAKEPAEKPAMDAPPPDQGDKKSGALNWKLSTKEHVEPPATRKKAAPKTSAKSGDIRPGEQK